MVLVCDHREPSAADWSTWVHSYVEGAVAHGSRALFVVSSGGGPNARQRQEVLAALSTNLGRSAASIKTAVCTDSVVARGIGKALAWMVGERALQSFGFDERAEALAFLGVPMQQRAKIALTARRFERELSASMHLTFPPSRPLSRSRRPDAG